MGETGRKGRFTGIYTGSSGIFFVVVYDWKMVGTLNGLARNMTSSCSAREHDKVGRTVLNRIIRPIGTDIGLLTFFVSEWSDK